MGKKEIVLIKKCQKLHQLGAELEIKATREITKQGQNTKKVVSLQIKLEK